MARKFYYDTGEEKIGPVTGQDLLRLLSTGQIQRDTWVRRSESSTWRQMENVDLKDEKKKEQSRGFWYTLWKSLPLSAIIGLICVFVFIIAILLLVGGILWKFFPFFLALFAIWLIYRAIK